jgi:hypothetical protein
MGSNPRSLLDPEQIIQKVYEESTDRIRVDAEVAFPEDALEIAISQDDDSIRVGGGGPLVTATSNGPKTGLDVNLINPSGVDVNLLNTEGLTNAAKTPFVLNITMPLADTEYEIEVPDNTTIFFLKPRLSSLKLAFDLGQSAIQYLTVYKGSVYTVDNVRTDSVSLFVQSSIAGNIVEFHGWTL